MSEQEMKKPVVIYTKDNCMQCNLTKKEMDRLGVSYELVNMSHDEEGLELVKAMGYKQAPVVVAGDDNHWGGFIPRRIKELAAEQNA